MNLLTCPLDTVVTDDLELEKVNSSFKSQSNLEVSIQELDCSPKSDSGILAQEIDNNFTDDFTDGKLDGENNFEPIAYQWSSPEYRKGYLIGMAKRIGIEYTLIRGVNTSKVIVIN
ncbi:MAG: hypothetical protein ACFCAD_19365 [Pleurocapsa sp.]